MVRLPSAPALGVPVPALNTASPASRSVRVRVPLSVRVGVVASSVTAPWSSPAITGRSLVPVMVMTTSWLVPSALCTVKVSTLVSPAARYCTLSLATS
ncbi:hypothetical protein D3C80_1617930 [compost metagenome]